MLVQAAEDCFRDGLAAFDDGRELEALALFEAAVEVERRVSRKPTEARYLSYFGLCLCLVAKRHRDGVPMCREAIEREPYNAALFLNLGRACLAAGRRKEALAAFDQGLRLEPTHDALRQHRVELGRRRRTAVPFLERSHPINVALGKLGSTWNRTASGSRR